MDSKEKRKIQNDVVVTQDGFKDWECHTDGAYYLKAVRKGFWLDIPKGTHPGWWLRDFATTMLNEKGYNTRYDYMLDNINFSKSWYAFTNGCIGNFNRGPGDEIFLVDEEMRTKGLKYTLLEELKEDPNKISLFKLTENLKNDKDLIIKIIEITKNGDNIKLASEEIQKDEKLQDFANKMNESLEKIANDCLKNSPNKLLEAINENGRILKYCPEEIKEDPKFIVAAFSSKLSYDISSDEENVKINNQERLFNEIIR